MKKLTKTLSLVLVVAMVLSLCVIGAGATFTDNDKITKDYSEAVTIATDLGIVSGVGNNTFAPAGTFTRAQAAVILTKMTTGANAAAIAPTTQTFKDVPTSFWGYKYIEYAAQAGLVAGIGNGKFSPNATLDGYQWALMLLKVLGFDSTGMTPANWQMLTAKAYYGNSKFSSVAITNAAVTREAATQMAYDALFSVSNGKTGYPVYYKYGTADQALINVYANLADAAVAANTLGENYSYRTTTETMNGTTLAKTVFGVTKGSGSDIYGRPSNVYTTSTKSKATTYGWTASTYSTAAKVVSKAPVLTYTTAIVPKTLALTLQNAGYKTTGSVDFITNGKTVTYTAAQVATYLAGTTAVGGNGCLSEFYVNSDNVLTTVVVVNTYVGTVAITEKDNATTTTVDERTLSVTVDSHTFKANYATPGFDAVYTAAATAAAAGKTMYALVVPSTDNTADGFAVSLALPTSKTVTPTSYTSGVSFTTSDATYKYSKNVVGNVASFNSQDVLLDQYGYVIAASTTVNAAKLAVVTAYDTSSSWNTNTYKARLVMADGTVSEVSTGTASPSDQLNTVVNYSESSGVYKLSSMGTTNTPVASYAGAPVGKFGDNAAVTTNGKLSITKGVASFTFGTTTTEETTSDNVYIANAQTIFVVRTGAGTTASPYTYTSYTGIANVPSMTSSDTYKAAGYVVSVDGTAKFVYIAGGSATAAVGNAVVFVPHVAQPVSVKVGNDTVTYFASKAVVNGTIQDVKLADDYALGVYTIKGTDANGNVTLAASVGYALTTGSVYSASGSTIKIGLTTYSVASDCVVYTYSASTGAIAVGTLADVTTTATGWYTLKSQTTTDNTAAIVNAIYVSVA